MQQMHSERMVCSSEWQTFEALRTLVGRALFADRSLDENAFGNELHDDLPIFALSSRELEALATHAWTAVTYLLFGTKRTLIQINCKFRRHLMWSFQINPAHLVQKINSNGTKPVKCSIGHYAVKKDLCVEALAYLSRKDQFKKSYLILNMQQICFHINSLSYQAFVTRCWMCFETSSLKEFGVKFEQK
jgi:hypothetical protein